MKPSSSLLANMSEFPNSFNRELSRTYIGPTNIIPVIMLPKTSFFGASVKQRFSYHNHIVMSETHGGNKQSPALQFDLQKGL